MKGRCVGFVVLSCIVLVAVFNNFMRQFVYLFQHTVHLMRGAAMINSAGINNFTVWTLVLLDCLTVYGWTTIGCKSVTAAEEPSGKPMVTKFATLVTTIANRSMWTRMQICFFFLCK